MTFSRLAGYLKILESTSSRIKITQVLRKLFRQVEPDEIDKVIYLSLGVLAPNFKGVILNLAEKMMIRVLALAYGQDGQMVTKLYKKIGDLGNVAEKLSSITDHSALPAGRRSPVTVTEVYEKLLEIAKDVGEGSQERKVEKLSNLLKSLDSLSARFVARIPMGRLRLGFSEKTVIAALAALDGTDEAEIEKAYNIYPDIGYIAKLAKTQKLQNAKPEVGIPVVPMLAQRLNNPSEMIKKMGEVAVEPKFDGLRAFIHYRRGHPPAGRQDFIKVFTRNMNAIPDGTFPELSEIGDYLKAKEVILDAEAIGVDPERQIFLDFQKTMTRRRKHGVTETQSKIPLQFQVFDLLLVDGKSLIDKPYRERRQELEKRVVNGKILRVDESTLTKDPDVIRKLHQKYLQMGLEGIIAKRADAPYVSGRVGWNWVKMKEGEGKTGKLADTIDCVIMGYSAGKGKRAGFGVGQFLAGVRDGDTFKTVTKVGTGLTDEQFRELNYRLKKLRTEEKPKEYLVHKDLTPDFWVIPEVVVELAADEITVSPKHTASLALRFPRLIRFRDDKSAREATTLKELKDLLRLSHA